EKESPANDSSPRAFRLPARGEGIACRRFFAHGRRITRAARDQRTTRGTIEVRYPVPNARLLRRRGVSPIPCPLAIMGNGVTLDVDMALALPVAAMVTFRVKQETTAAHCPSSSELETE
ncbi:hypothetical protein BHE74_00055065, partial [Ensete ventricosum]